MIHGGARDSEKENFKAEIIFNMTCPYNYQPLLVLIIIFIGY